MSSVFHRGPKGKILKIPGSIEPLRCLLRIQAVYYVHIIINGLDPSQRVSYHERVTCPHLSLGQLHDCTRTCMINDRT